LQDEINVVVDDTDWGYRIGEIEIILTDPAQVTQAIEKIEDLAKKLGTFDPSVDLVLLPFLSCMYLVVLFTCRFTDLLYFVMTITLAVLEQGFE
jgi:hypothetical protein